MSAQDRPGAVSPIPGDMNFDAHGAMSAPGTASEGGLSGPETSGPLSDRIQQGTIGDSAVVTILGASLANADVVQVGPNDTLQPSDVGQYSTGNRFTATDLLHQTGAGLGNVITPPHPAAATVGSMADQLRAARTSS